MMHTTCVMLFQRIWVTVWCANAGANWRSLRPQSDHRTSAYCMRTKSRRWPIWSVTTNYCGYSGTDGPNAEADGTGETDWIPVPSDPSWFRETLENYLCMGGACLTNKGMSLHMSVAMPNLTIVGRTVGRSAGQLVPSLHFSSVMVTQGHWQNMQWSLPVSDRPTAGRVLFWEKTVSTINCDFNW